MSGPLKVHVLEFIPSHGFPVSVIVHPGIVSAEPLPQCFLSSRIGFPVERDRVAKNFWRCFLVRLDMMTRTVAVVFMLRTPQDPGYGRFPSPPPERLETLFHGCADEFGGFWSRGSVVRASGHGDLESVADGPGSRFRDLRDGLAPILDHEFADPVVLILKTDFQ